MPGPGAANAARVSNRPASSEKSSQYRRLQGSRYRGLHRTRVKGCFARRMHTGVREDEIDQWHLLRNRQCRNRQQQQNHALERGIEGLIQLLESSFRVKLG